MQPCYSPATPLLQESLSGLCMQLTPQLAYPSCELAYLTITTAPLLCLVIMTR